jgi:hypothetical protein
MGKKKRKKAKKLTQEQEDILGLARQVLRLEEAVRDLKRTLAETMNSVQAKLSRAGEALK